MIGNAEISFTDPIADSVSVAGSQTRDLLAETGVDDTPSLGRYRRSLQYLVLFWINNIHMLKRADGQPVLSARADKTAYKNTKTRQRRVLQTIDFKLEPPARIELATC